MKPEAWRRPLHTSVSLLRDPEPQALPNGNQSSPGPGARARTYLEGTSAKLFEPKAQAAILMIINSYTSFPQYLATMLVKSLFNLLGTEET